MGILRELLHDFTFGLVDRDEGDDALYRCVKCGSGFDRNHRTCPECGSQFVAPVEEGGDDPDPGPPGPGQ